MYKPTLKERIVNAMFCFEEAAENWKAARINDFTEDQEMDELDDELLYSRNQLYKLFAELTGIDMSDQIDENYHEDDEEDIADA